MNYTPETINELIDAYAKDLSEHGLSANVEYMRTHCMIIVDIIIRIRPSQFIEIVNGELIDYVNLKRTYLHLQKKR